MNIPNREEIEKILASRISGTLRRDLKELMGLLGNPPDLLNVPAGYWSNGFVRMQKELEPALLDIYVRQSERFINDTMIGVDWNLINTTAEDWARKYTFELVKGIEDNSRAQLQKMVSRFYSDKWTLGDLQDRLGRWYGPIRAEMIAITETTRAAVQGERDTVALLGQETGIEMRPFWECAMDELVCPVCGPRAGREILDKKFPPIHPRCRCWVSYKLPKGYTINPEMNQAQKEFQEKLAQQRIFARQAAQAAQGGRIMAGIGQYLNTSKMTVVQRKPINDTINVINKIHGIPDNLSTIDVYTEVIKNSDGYIKTTNTGLPIEIVINSTSKTKEWTLAHEFGHYLDNQVIGPAGGFGSESTADIVKPWLQAVRESKSYKGLMSMKAGNTFPVHGMQVRWPDQYLDYLTTERELFARSYSQYIAQKSGNASLMAAVQEYQKDSYLFQQWDNDDFKPIFSAIESILSDLGLLK